MAEIKCDICGKSIKLTQNSKHLLEKDNLIVYCKECADSLNISQSKAKMEKIKIYKI